jgi:hypothetical protein
LRLGGRLCNTPERYSKGRAQRMSVPVSEMTYSQEWLELEKPRTAQMREAPGMAVAIG